MTRSDTGLVAAITMGIVLANLRGVDLPEDRPFIKTVVQLAIGVLFIAISATVTPASLRGVIWPALALLAGWGRITGRSGRSGRPRRSYALGWLPRRVGHLFVRSRKGSSRCVIDVYPRRARSAAVLAAAVPSRVAGWPVQSGLFGR